MIKDAPVLPLHGIVMTDESVRALTRTPIPKTQTRRLITRGSCTVSGNRVNERVWAELDFGGAWVDPGLGGGEYLKVRWPQQDDTVHRVRAPFEIGQNLYVKETWSVGDSGGYLVDPCLHYRADSAQRIIQPAFLMRQTGDGKYTHRYGWRSSMMMPRWAARYFLEVTAVRIQHLQDITPDDVRAEGVTVEPHELHGASEHGRGMIYRARFATLWDTLHRKHAPWIINPWVIAYTFKTIPRAVAIGETQA